VAFAITRPVTGECVIAVNSWQDVIGQQHCYDGRQERVQLFSVARRRLRPLIVALQRRGPFNRRHSNRPANRPRCGSVSPCRFRVCAIAMRVRALGSFTSNGNLRSSAIRSISNRIASDREAPLRPTCRQPVPEWRYQCGRVEVCGPDVSSSVIAVAM
jgi:hypothetical protein